MPKYFYGDDHQLNQARQRVWIRWYTAGKDVPNIQSSTSPQTHYWTDDPAAEEAFREELQKAKVAFKESATRVKSTFRRPMQVTSCHSPLAASLRSYQR